MFNSIVIFRSVDCYFIVIFSCASWSQLCAVITRWRRQRRSGSGRLPSWWSRQASTRHSTGEAWPMRRPSALETGRIWNLIFCHFFTCHIAVKSWLASYNWWRKLEYLAKTTAKPQVTSNFLTCRGQDSKPGSGERQIAVGGNALDTRPSGQALRNR